MSALISLMLSITSALFRPQTRHPITLFRLVWPAAIVTEERGSFKSFAKNSMQAWLALPSIGGAVRESFSASPTSPVMAFFFARGWTLTAKIVPAGDSLSSSIIFRAFPKDRCPHAHASRSLFDGDFEIVRHPHGENVHPDFREVTRGDAV